MRYKLYTTVDITNTGQYRAESGKEDARCKEQNYQTVLQTLGIRANITSYHKPEMLDIGGRAIGFDTDELLRVWRFDFETERDNLFEKDGDPVGYLKEDFHLVPYISGLSEVMDQHYAVFNTSNPGANIVFYKKQ
jgi:hypothetical protein